MILVLDTHVLATTLLLAKTREEEVRLATRDEAIVKAPLTFLVINPPPSTLFPKPCLIDTPSP